LFDKFSIKTQVTFLFVVCLAITAVIVSTANFSLRSQSLDTLSKEIFYNQTVLLQKIQDARFERMEYYAFSSDPGSASIWRLRGRRSPIDAVKSQNERRIEIALQTTFDRLKASSTLDNIAIFSRDGTLIAKLPAEDNHTEADLNNLGQALSQSVFQQNIERGFTSVSDQLQQFVVFPIYSNATVLAYVYYGLDFKDLSNAFEADSNSLLLSREFPSSMTVDSVAVAEDSALDLLEGSKVVMLGAESYVASVFQLPLLDKDGTELIFAKNVDHSIRTGERNFFQGMIIAVLFLIVSGLVIFVLLRDRLTPLNAAIVTLRSISEGDLSQKLDKKRDDEIGRMTDALASLQQQLQSFVVLRGEAARRTTTQQNEILRQTQTLAQLIPIERRRAMETTIDEIEEEIESSRATTDSLKFDVEEDSVGGLFAKSFSSLARELTAQYDQLENLVQERTAELEVARDRADAASEAKSKFLANMTHELRTPLNAIIGYSEMLAEEAEEEDALDWLVDDLGKIRNSAVHQLQLINDILDHSKIEAGKLDLYVDEFDLTETVSFIKSISAPLAEKNRNQILFEHEDALGNMTSDETRLRQTLLNFLSNACKFTEEGQVKLTITSSREDNVDWVSFAVTDTGIGMSEEQLDTIFDDFTQAETSTAAKYGGTGLGLSITKRLVEMMHGQMNVTSQLGEGSRFEMLLPRVIRQSSN